MSVNLRNAPVDRRRMSPSDRSQYKAGDRVSAVKRARAYRGKMAQRENIQRSTTDQKPGTGGFTHGIGLQQARLRKVGEEERRAEALRGV